MRTRTMLTDTKTKESEVRTLFHLIYNNLMAGMEGFEPPNAWTKTMCLTTWRHPNSFHSILKNPCLYQIAIGALAVSKTCELQRQ